MTNATLGKKSSNLKPAAAGLAFAMLLTAQAAAPVFNPDDQRRTLWGANIPLAYTNAVRAGINTFVLWPTRAWHQMKDGKVPADEARALRDFDRLCASDGVTFMPYLFEIHNKEWKKLYPRVLRDGKKFEGNADANDPELKRRFREFAEGYARYFADFESVRGVEVSSEIRDKSCPSFTARNAADFKAATGLDVPAEAVERAAPHWSKLKDLPKDRVIDENYPVYAYYKWFWRTGDGWNDYQSMASDAFHRAFAAKGRSVLTAYSGAMRVPPIWGSGGTVDVISQWLYPYPQPFNVGYMCSQLQEMAKGCPGQQVHASVQAIAYRCYTAPLDSGLENPPAWSKEWPNGRYITVPPDLLRESLWTIFARRVDVIQVHGWDSLWDGSSVSGKDSKNYVYTNPETKDVLQDCLQTVAIPLGPLFRAMPELPGAVAVLESSASSILSGIAPWDWTMPAYHYGVLAVAANLSPVTLYEEDLAANGVPPSVKVILCPNCDVLTRGACEALKAFRARGGKICGEKTLCPALGAPDALLPAFDRENLQKGDSAEEVLPANVRKCGLRRTGRQDDVNVRVTAEAIRKAVAGFVKPHVEVEGDHLLVHARSAGAAADCLFVINDRRTYGDYVGPWKLVLEKGEPNRGVAVIRRPAAAVYDLVRHERVPFETKDGVTRIPVDFATTDGRALLVCDRVPGPLEIRVKDEGATVKVTLRSPDTGLLVPVRLDGVSSAPYYAVVRDGVWTRSFAKGPFGTIAAKSLIDGTTALDASKAPDYPIRSVEMNKARVTGGFWFDRLETNRTATLKSVWTKCHETPRIANFTNAANRTWGTFGGIPFDDSDVYKVMEGTAYILSGHPDRAYESQMTWLIGQIARAQEPDGYLYTARTLCLSKKTLGRIGWMGPTRWGNVACNHELYNVGHLYEAAVAWHRATGRGDLLDVAERNATLVGRTFGPDEYQLRDVSGHEEIELALCKLYRETGKRRYLDLARHFVDQRGRNPLGRSSSVVFSQEGDLVKGDEIDAPDAYRQNHRPFVAQRSAVGHAVRAGYLYCGVTDVAVYSGETAYDASLNAIWRDIVSSKLHLTGGIGARPKGEAFGLPYELPNDHGQTYLETCAAIGLALWNDRLFRRTGEAKYVDVLERTIYNGFASGVSLKGDAYFYQNPLATKGEYERSKWFGCSCCPVNDIRFIPQIPSFAYATDAKGTLYWNLFMRGEAEVGGWKFRVETDYPWSGKAKLTVLSSPSSFTSLKLRIPGWAVGKPVPSDLYVQTVPSSFMEVSVAVNGAALNGCPGMDGYVSIGREWKAGDVVSVDIPMPVKRIRAHAKVAADRGRLAVERGPVVYCAEGVDNGGKAYAATLPADATFEDATIAIGDKRFPALKASNGLVLIPYCLWGNRQPGNDLQTWFAEK